MEGEAGIWGKRGVRGGRRERSGRKSTKNVSVKLRLSPETLRGRKESPYRERRSGNI